MDVLAFIGIVLLMIGGCGMDGGNIALSIIFCIIGIAILGFYTLLNPDEVFDYE